MSDEALMEGVYTALFDWNCGLLTDSQAAALIRGLFNEDSARRLREMAGTLEIMAGVR